MPRYWVIAPSESKPPEKFDKVWQFDLGNNLISIGWKPLGDVSKMGREELVAAMALHYPHKPPTTHALWANMIWAFYHEINTGDLIIARRGLKTIAGVGIVSQPAFYSPARSSVHEHPNFLEVSWQEQPRDRTFSTLVFQRPTLAELSVDRYQTLVQGAVPPPALPEPLDEIEDPNEFVLEKYLEDFIVSNFDVIFKGKLEIYEDADECEGQQYDTNEIGRIDILARDPFANSFVVIELKKGRPSDKVIGQTLRYMGWIKKNLCTEGQGVKGLVICRGHDPKLSYALEITKEIDVRYYSVSFKLKESP